MLNGHEYFLNVFSEKANLFWSLCPFTSLFCIGQTGRIKWFCTAARKGLGYGFTYKNTVHIIYARMYATCGFP